LHSSGFADQTTGYPAWIDVNSFLDYFIVSEVSRNVDGFKKSVFFFKDKDSKGGLIHAGPVWDFDWAWKNIYDCSAFQATDGSGWSYKINDCDNIYPNSNGWMVRLLQDEAFANSLNKRYFEFRNSYLSSEYLNSFIDSLQNLASEAQARHYSKWNILSLSVGAPEVDSQPSTYTGQVSKFKNWIQTRLNWLDTNMPGNSTNIAAYLVQNEPSFRIFPNPASSVVFMESSTEIEDIRIVQLNGKCVFSKANLTVFSTKLDLSELPSGVYFVRLKTKNRQIFHSKLVII
jgi:hypothetical protein